ncbi:alpha/beta hydrolase family esterase [Bdellovibrio sp.]|uniref:alpha/beta hydrolase family esterase n=1 Tax=Bdellovibrio sp. TaxID=28201 RepID=UPI0039E3D270
MFKYSKKSTIFLAMSALLIIAFQNFTASTLPSKDLVAKAGIQKIFLQTSQGVRTFSIYVPSTFSKNTALKNPLLLAFHGGEGTGENLMDQLGSLKVLAEKSRIIVVYPDGLHKNWADGRGVTEPDVKGINDVQFVRELVAYIKTKFIISQSQIYAMGMSNGGIFSHRLACEASDIFAAIGSDVGPMALNLRDICKASSPVSVVAIQGLDDPLIPYVGGENTNPLTKNLGDGGSFSSWNQTLTTWKANNGCLGEPQTSYLPIKVQDGTAVQKWRYDYTQCRQNAEIDYYLVKGMGHVWPPGAPPLKLQGNTSGNIDATQVFVDFFLNHKKVFPEIVLQSEVNFFHQVGYLDKLGWSTNKVRDTRTGYLNYGPYMDVGRNKSQALFYMMIDNHLGVLGARNIVIPSNEVVAVIDIYDATRGEVLAIQQIKRRDFKSSMNYQAFVLPFSSAGRESNAIEFRVYSYANAYLNVDGVIVK